MEEKVECSVCGRRSRAKRVVETDMYICPECWEGLEEDANVEMGLHPDWGMD